MKRAALILFCLMSCTAQAQTFDRQLCELLGGLASVYARQRDAGMTYADALKQIPPQPRDPADKSIAALVHAVYYDPALKHAPVVVQAVIETRCSMARRGYPAW